ncbi:P-II family nitrogen regulator [Lachnospiraceae bacterium C1.1]|nr:P-II family nitrogen regulator [Lachnospiraceae bacterium C1.1]
MKFSRIEVVTSLYKLSDLQKALGNLGVTGMTVVQALGCGVENGTQEYEIEMNKTPELLPKQMMMMVVPSEIVEKVVDVIEKELYTGHIGDGKIFISDIENIIRVRTGEEGEAALV